MPALVGLACPFGKEVVHGAERISFAPTAFDKSVSSNDDVACLVDHNEQRLLGRRNRQANSLQLFVRDDGLHFRCELPETALARDITELAKSHLLSGVSVGIELEQFSKQHEKIKRFNTTYQFNSSYPLVVVDTCHLAELSIITGGQPAFSQTHVALEDGNRQLSMQLKYLELASV